MKVDEIIAPVALEMADFEKKFVHSMQSNAPLLDKITNYIVRRKGKQMRPLFVFLTAKMLGEVNEKTFDAAILAELLHTATLVHDDVVDDAHERRGFFSVNALWKNKIAVLVGDYMLSKILLLSIEKENTDLLQVIARSVREMSEGELLQIEKARTLDFTEALYFDVIRQKTASLIATCCESAAISVGETEKRDAVRKMGEYIGIAFQIKDDIFDFGEPGAIGKPTGLDIREQKITLPMIYTLNNSPKVIRDELLRIIKTKNENPESIRRAVNLVIEHGGINYAYDRMNEFKEKALAILAELPENDSKQALKGLIEYTTTRMK